MHFRHVLRYDAPPTAVFAMLADESFREAVCHEQHTTECSATITRYPASMTVRVDQSRPSDGIPSFARKIVGDQIHISQNEEWSSETDAALDVGVPGKPGHLKGTIALRPEGSGTVETVEGELRVHIPLVGGKLESLVAELFEHALVAEQRVGTAWLAREA